MRFSVLSLPLLLASFLIAAPSQAEPLEPVAAQGPSARVEQKSSANQQRNNQHSPISHAAADSGRRLSFGPTASKAANAKRPAGERGSDMLKGWAESSGVTAAAALAFVVGLFMLLAWVVKRGTPKSAQILPADAIRILGRVPLGARQYGQLLHLGNKLVLVTISQTGVEKLAEIDDPQEVVRLLALCSKTSGKGSQKEFEEIFGQFAKEKTESGFLGSETSLFGGNSSATGERRYA